MPGTHIESHVILSASSTTTIGQHLEKDYIYFGVPARKFKRNVFFEDALEKIIESQTEDVEELRKKTDEFITKRSDKEVSS